MMYKITNYGKNNNKKINKNKPNETNWWILTPENLRIIIENDASDDALIVEKLFVNTTTKMWGIQAACYEYNEIPPTSYPFTENAAVSAERCGGTFDTIRNLESFCIDNECLDCTPARQSWDFDITRSNQYIDNATYHCQAPLFTIAPFATISSQIAGKPQL